jgi:outer membrane receptor protein involved in Fe transport
VSLCLRGAKKTGITDKMYYKKIILIFGIGVSSILAQETTITGFVIDAQSALPIEGANIYTLPSGTGTTTDEDGYFNMQYAAQSENDSLIISYLGYHSLRIPVKEYHNNSILQLRSKVFELGKAIEVTADKINLVEQDIPHAMRIIGVDEIERLGSGEISDLFKSTPAVRIEGNDLDGRTVQIRGSNSDEVNVYIDGILINNLRFDHVADLSVIPTESIEQMEILKGSNLLLLGNGAFGGVVNITTRKRFEHSYTLKIKGGSFGTRYFLGEINIPLSDQWTINYFGQYNHSTPEIEFFPDEKYSSKTKSDNITTEKQNHHLTLSYINSQGQFSSKFLGYFFDYNKPSWENLHNNYIFSLGYKGNLLGVTELDLTANYSRADDNIQRTPLEDYTYNSEYISDRLNVRFAKRLTFAATELQLLTEYYHDELNTSSKTRSVRFYEASVYENRAALAGVFTFKDTMKTKQKFGWNTSIGFRGDFHADGKSDFTYSAGLRLDVPGKYWRMKPYAHFGKNVKYATLVENAFLRDLADFFRDDSEPTRLKPEYSNSGEIGMDIQYIPGHGLYESLDISFSLFSNTFFNKLLTRPFDNLISQAQIGRNVTKGIETSLQLNNLWQDFSILTSFFALDISDPFLYPFKPDLNLTAQIDYFPMYSLYFRAVYFYEGKSTAWYYDVNDQFQTEQVPNFYDFDVSIGYKLQMAGMILNLQLAGYNILDNSGYRYYALKKRFVQGSLTIRF